MRDNKGWIISAGTHLPCTYPRTAAWVQIPSRGAPWVVITLWLLYPEDTFNIYERPINMYTCNP